MTGRSLAVALLSAMALAPALACAADPVPAASGEQRIALVIGNGAYRDAPLLNPPNDAEDVAKRLSELGFRVMLHQNATQRQMKQAIRDFSAALRGGGVGLFYF